MKDDTVDWSEPVLQRWLGTISKKSTKRVYKSGFRFYQQFTNLTATQLIDEALEDAKRDPREKTDVVKQRLLHFYDWLVKEAPKRTGPEGDEVGKGVSQNMASTYVSSARSLYGTYDVFVKFRGRSRLPKPKVINKRMIVSNVDVKKLLDHTTLPRDRAIILTMFQSGMDVSTLCGLTYEDVAEGLKNNEHPLQLTLQRPKSGVDFCTFLGKDAVEAIRAYLNDLKSKGLTLSLNDSLFIKGSYKTLKKEGLSTNLVQNMMREVAIKSGLVDKNLNGKDMNPLSPHALRESFGSIMISKGVPDSIVDFWLGHEIGVMGEAYKQAKFEDVKRTYLEREVFLSVSQPTTNLEELKAEVEAKVEAKAEQRNKELQDLVNRLTQENMDTRIRVLELATEVEAKAEQRNKQLKTLVNDLESELESMKAHQRTVDEVLDILDLDVEDAKIISAMILDWRERTLRREESEAFSQP